MYQAVLPLEPAPTPRLPSPELLNSAMRGDLALVFHLRSPETFDHSINVGILTELLATHCGLDVDEAARAGAAAQLHDIGKIVLPDGILNKPSLLTPDELALVRRHTTWGRQLLNRPDNSRLEAAAVIAHQHHERWDGHGYPQGLKGRSIHLWARITAICDVFEALRRHRSYRPAWAPARIRNHLIQGRGLHFDPGLLDIMLNRFEEFLRITRPDQTPANLLAQEATP